MLNPANRPGTHPLQMPTSPERPEFAPTRSAARRCPGHAALAQQLEVEPQLSHPWGASARNLRRGSVACRVVRPAAPNERIPSGGPVPPLAQLRDGHRALAALRGIPRSPKLDGRPPATAPRPARHCLRRAHPPEYQNLGGHAGVAFRKQDGTDGNRRRRGRNCRKRLSHGAVLLVESACHPSTLR